MKMRKLRYGLSLVGMLAILNFSGCASMFFDGDGRNGDATEYDRNYASVDDPTENCDDDTCDGDDTATMQARKSSPPKAKPRVSQAIDARDVIMGMTRQEVMASWGEPVVREMAGTKALGHEKWTYGSRYSTNSSRTVIFENGRVAGWYR